MQQCRMPGAAEHDKSNDDRHQGIRARSVCDFAYLPFQVQQTLLLPVTPCRQAPNRLGFLSSGDFRDG